MADIVVPYIKVSQRGEIFFLTKFKAKDLKRFLYFQFHDPYLELKPLEEKIKYQEYVEKLKNKGVNYIPSEVGIQRRLQVERIENIKNYLEESVANFLPSSILLSVDVTNDSSFIDNYSDYEDRPFGELTFSSNSNFTIIDGQHRLAGLFLCSEEIINDFEITAVLLLNVSLSTASKLFSDINGKQKPVNRSLIYDLQEKISNDQISEIKLFHTICQKFYIEKKSPLYRQIKMLGIGSGSISQAFFIDYVKEAINKTNLGKAEPQIIYEQLFFYFKAFQSVFPDYWPVPKNYKSDEDVDGYSRYVLKEIRSQLTKTNGFGAIMLSYPSLYEKSSQNYDSYVSLLKRIESFDWTLKGFIGTGKGLQKKVSDEILSKII